MKKLLVIMSTIISQSSFAWFNVNADVYVSSNRIEVSVSNYGNSYMQCRGNVFGMDQFGAYVRESFFMRSILPGSYAYAYAYAYGASYFVRGNANVQCRFLNY